MKPGRGMNKGRGSGRGSGGRRNQTRTGEKGVCRQQPDPKKVTPLEFFSNVAAGAAKLLNFHQETIIPKIGAVNKPNIGAAAPALQQKLPAIAAIVDVDSCILCGECEEACLVKAISVGETVEVDGEKCLGCGQCVETCPADALSLVNKQ